MSNTSTPHRFVAIVVLAAQLAGTMPALAVTPTASAPSAAARSAGATLIRRAQGLYDQARYDEAVTVLYGPLGRGELKGTELRDARVLMARCYVKKGLPERAKDLFGAVVAADPAFVLDASRGDAEEIAVFGQVKPAAPVAPAPAPAKPHGPPSPAAATPPPATKPEPRKPNIGPVPQTNGGWLARHKLLATTLAVGAGAGAVLIATSGGGTSSTPRGPDALPAFPPPPN